jgi:hypothetical protein
MKMKKISVLTLVATLSFTASVFAAPPVTEFNNGSGSIGFSQCNYNGEFAGKGKEKNKAKEFYGSYVLSDNLAFTADIMNSGTKNITGVGDTSYRFNKIGVQYKMTDNISFLVGNLNRNVAVKGVDDRKNSFYAGASVGQRISDNMSAYASYVFASKYSDYNLGITYDITKNIYFDVGYRNIKAKNIGASVNRDFTAKGINWSVGYKI